MSKTTLLITIIAAAWAGYEDVRPTRMALDA